MQADCQRMSMELKGMRAAHQKVSMQLKEKDIEIQELKRARHKEAANEDRLRLIPSVRHLSLKSSPKFLVFILPFPSAACSSFRVQLPFSSAPCSTSGTKLASSGCNFTSFHSARSPPLLRFCTRIVGLRKSIFKGGRDMVTMSSSPPQAEN